MSRRKAVLARVGSEKVSSPYHRHLEGGPALQLVDFVNLAGRGRHPGRNHESAAYVQWRYAD